MCKVNMNCSKWISKSVVADSRHYYGRVSPIWKTNQSSYSNSNTSPRFKYLLQTPYSALATWRTKTWTIILSALHIHDWVRIQWRLLLMNARCGSCNQLVGRKFVFYVWQSVCWQKCKPVAAGALDVHEVGVGMLDKPLQLVLSLLLVVEGVEQILGQRHLDFSEMFQGTWVRLYGRSSLSVT